MNLADIRELETITIKYFESGHTFMSADSFHHVVENEIRRMKFVEDFDEFRSIIDKREESILMNCTDFVFYKAAVSKSKTVTYPKLKEMREVQFRKGSKKLFWKTSPVEEYKSSIFLQQKFIKVMRKKDVFPARIEDRGIPAEKKPRL